MDTHKHAEGRLRIYVEAGLDRGLETPIPYQGARLGRATTNDIGLQDPALSRHHCQLFFKPGSGLWVRDLESANGTLVNGHEIAEARLSPGDTLAIGDTVIRIRGSEVPDDPDASQPEPIPDTPADPEEMPNPQIPGLVMLDEIGQGAMASVWRARQESLDRIVAVKILNPELTTDETEIADFVNEARAAAKVTHANIVQVYDAAQLGKTCYMVMEYVEGKTLGEMLREKGALPQKEAFRMLRRVAEALDHAWRKVGIVHRDIKPDNIIIGKDGTPKVADLGLAKMADPGTLTAKVKRGALEGTPNYMSPEQARGDERIDCRSDMYSLGATLYHALTGNMPFDGTPPLEVADKQITAQIPNPRNVDPSIKLGAAQFISRLMMKDPTKRFEDWKEVLTTMRKVGAGGMIHVKQAGESISTIAIPVTQSDTSSGRPTPPVETRRAREGATEKVPLALRILGWAAIVAWFVILARNRLAQRVALEQPPPDESQPATPWFPPPTPSTDTTQAAPEQITPPPRRVPTRPMPTPAHAALTEQIEADRRLLETMKPETTPNRLHELTQEEQSTLREACSQAAQHIADRQFLPAYEVLDKAAGTSASPAFATEIERTRSLVLAVGRMNQTIMESIRNRIGEEVKIHIKGNDRTVLLQAMSGDTVNGAMVQVTGGQTVTNPVLF